jgi:membrane protein DedA with SNARE-associated domain
MALASGAWYGLISYLAWRAGSDWDAVTALLARSGRVVTIVACVLAVVGALVWYRHQRQPRAEP